jgi:ATP-dependent DNA helicase DinG
MFLTFLNYFPSKYTPRDMQVKIINEIETAIKEKKFKKILICAPTGSGKSHITATIAKAFESSITITAQKILQDQYTEDFPWIHPMKGKGNFPCLSLYDSQKISYDEALKDKSLTCNNGNCSWIIKKNGKNRIEFCEYHSDITQFEVKDQGTENEKVNSPKDKCYYYNQKFSALFSSHSIFNFYSFFQTKLFNSGYENLLEKSCLIVDEAHEIEDQIINFLEIKITKYYLDEVNFKFSDYDLKGNEEIIDFLEQLGSAYQKKISEMGDSNQEDSRISSLKNKLQKIDSIAIQIKEDSENFVVDIMKNIKTNEIDGISITPLQISNYVESFFDYPIQIFLSATMNKEMFCQTMGFLEEDCYFIEIEKSPFPLANRRVEFLDITSLSNKPPKSEWLKIYQKIHEIMSQFHDKRGLILTSSKIQCKEIFTNMPEDASLRLSILHSSIEDKKEEVLREHEEMDTDVLLSPSLWYGVDLKDELSRFQIIVKTPFPFLGDRRTKIKKMKNPLWYNYKTLVKLLQGFGRSTRNKNDFAVTYVLDSDAKKLLNSMKKYVPSSYYDILDWE